MKLKEIYDKQVEAWKERGIVEDVEIILNRSTPLDNSFEWREEVAREIVKLFSSSRQKDTIELLEAEIERKRGKILMLRGKEVDNLYNSAIDEDIAYLEEQLKLIKKEI